MNGWPTNRMDRLVVQLSGFYHHNGLDPASQRCDTTGPPHWPLDDCVQSSYWTEFFAPSDFLLKNSHLSYDTLVAPDARTVLWTALFFFSFSFLPLEWTDAQATASKMSVYGLHACMVRAGCIRVGDLSKHGDGRYGRRGVISGR